MFRPSKSPEHGGFLKTHTLRTEVWVPQPLTRVFDFFSDVRNLDRITPPWLGFKILPPIPDSVKLGSLINYRLLYRGLPVRWRTRITNWQPPDSFTDTQIRGPYRRWIHHHAFSTRDGGTWMVDHIEYAVPGGLFEPLIHSWLVGPDVRSIFDYRRAVLLSLFASA